MSATIRLCRPRRPIAFTVFAAILMTTCTGSGETPQESFPPVVPVVPIATRMVRPAIESFGTVVQMAQIEIFPANESLVEHIDAEEGEAVFAGQQLAVLRSDRIRLSVEQATALLQSKIALEALADEQLLQGRRTVESQLILIDKTAREVAQKTEEYHTIHDLFEKRQRLFEIGGIAEGDIEALRTQYLRARTEMEQVIDDLRIRRIGYRDRDILTAGIDAPTDPDQRVERLIAINTAGLRAQLDVARADRFTAQVELRRVEQALADTVIRSPIAGIIAHRALDAGALARPQNPLFTVMDVDRVMVQTHVGEDQMDLVIPGTEATVTIGRGNSAIFSGTVALVAPYIDAGSRTVRIRILVENPDRRFVPGMFCGVRLFTGAPQRATIVPTAAVVDGDPPRVFVVRDGVLVESVVTIIDPSGPTYAVTGLFDDNDLVAAAARDWFHDGMAVTPTRRLQ